MICTLCHTSISLWELDAEGIEGLPAHEHCAVAFRAEAAAALAEAELMILNEHDPRRHRRGVTPTL